jgi:hypothetical protein
MLVCRAGLGLLQEPDVFPDELKDFGIHKLLCFKTPQEFVILSIWEVRYANPIAVDIIALPSPYHFLHLFGPRTIR